MFSARRLAFVLLLGSCAAASSLPLRAQPSDEPTRPPSFSTITATPADRQHLTAHVQVNHEGDGEGEEMPSAMGYYRAPTDYSTNMTVTDQSLCQRPTERSICAAFRRLIASPPALGTDITETRIGGAGYRTVFLSRIEGVPYGGTDAVTAFLGGDTQDPPAVELVVYLYARRGTNLIQLTAPIGAQTAPPKSGESDAAYYRACVNDALIAKAQATAMRLVELFRLER